ncbi:MAG: TonB family protein [Acidobacteriaceae bacterium]
MQPTPPEIEPEQPNPEQQETPEESRLERDAPVSVVPHEAVTRTVSAPVRIRTSRYGELEEHELIHLLDSIEDERARARFRESLYISVFIWMAVAWVLFYGPKYLWHAPKLITPTEALQQQAQVELNAPRMPHRAPGPPPKISRGTLARLKAMEPKPAPPAAKTPAAPGSAAAPSAPESSSAAPPKPTPPTALRPAPPQPTPAMPIPSAPQPRLSSNQPVPNAPMPQPTQPSFNMSQTAREQMQQAMRGSQNANRNRNMGINGNVRGAQAGNGVEILSDTQGVDFSPYIRRILQEIYEQWIPLLPEETQPPLNKSGMTMIRFTINADGTIAAMNLDGSSHDDALNRAAWGSITGVGQFPPLPKAFHGPNLELRIHFLVNEPNP